MVAPDEPRARPLVSEDGASPEAPFSIAPKALVAGKGRRGRDLAARRIVLGLLGRMRNGSVIIKEGERRHLCGRPLPGERVPELQVLSPEAWRAVASEGSAGLGRAWFSGFIDCASTDELTMFLRVIVRNLDGIERAQALTRKVLGPLQHFVIAPRARVGNRTVDRRNVRAHYDLGNDFFSLFLDETMTYSSAIFSAPAISLHDAQVQKLDRICKMLALSAADHVLEIGTGWGSFAIHAASRYGCRVTTTTISARQYELASERVKSAGLEHLVTVLAEDYRDLSGSFDKLVSIEMIEALDWRQYETFFQQCSKLLKPEGMMALQAIVIGERYFERAKHSEDFIKRYIFPGSCIPSIGAIVEASAKTKQLDLVSLQDFGQHYAETLRRWRKRLLEHEDEIAALEVDEAMRRLFVFYLCYCEAGFSERRIGDVQAIFAKPAWRPGALSLPG